MDRPWEHYANQISQIENNTKTILLLLESKNKEKNQTTKTGSRRVVTRGHGSGESGEILDKTAQSCSYAGQASADDNAQAWQCPQYCTEHWNHAESKSSKCPHHT